MTTAIQCDMLKTIHGLASNIFFESASYMKHLLELGYVSAKYWFRQLPAPTRNRIASAGR